MLFLIAGHSIQSPGAIAIINEANQAIWLRDTIAYILAKNYVQTALDNDNHPIIQVINNINARAVPSDIVIEIHFNAFNSKARGTEAFLPHDASEKQRILAEKLLFTIANTLKTPNRGVKHPNQSQHKSLAILSQTTCHAIIIEVCFSDNPEDANSYEEHKLSLAKNIAQTILLHLQNTDNY